MTNLVPNLIGIDPDDAFSIVPYEKGNTFLFYLEKLLGGPQVFEPFLKNYFNEYKQKSVSTEEWKAYLYRYFESQKKVSMALICVIINYIYMYLIHIGA